MIVAPTGTAPTFQVTVPPERTPPAVAETKVVFAGTGSLTTTEAASTVPLLVTVIVYRRVSPGFRLPPLTSPTVSSITRIGAAAVVVMLVASLGAGVPGSSVTRLIPPAAVTLPWLLITTPPASGLFSLTLKEMVTLPLGTPPPGSVPIATVSGFASVRTSVGSLEVRLPATSVALVGIGSERLTLDASALPVLVTMMV